MSFVNRDNKVPQARCSECDADLITSSKNSKVYCSNMTCEYVRKPHPTGPEPNAGHSELRD